MKKVFHGIIFKKNLSDNFSKDFFKKRHLSFTKDVSFGNYFIKFENSSYKKTKLDRNSYTFDYENIKIIFHGQLFKGKNKDIGNLAKLYLSKKNIFKHMNGHYCGFILNKTDESLTYFRDPYGCETLYYFQEKDYMIFSNDLRIFQKNDKLYPLSKKSAGEFLHYMYVPSPKTIFKNVWSILPGHKLIFFLKDEIISGNQINYNFSLYKNITIEGNLKSLDYYLKEFELILIDSISNRIRNAKKVGLLFSGGKDSTAIAIAISKIPEVNVLAITLSSDEMREDVKRSIEICKYLGLKQKIISIDEKDIKKGFEVLVSNLDQPMADPASISFVIALQNKFKDIDTFIDGTGNDYYFGFKKTWSELAYSKRKKVEKYIPKFLWSSFIFFLSIYYGKKSSMLKKWSRPIEETFVGWNGWSVEELKHLFQINIDLESTFLWQKMREFSFQGSDVVTTQTGVYGQIYEPHTVTRKGKVIFNQIYNKEIQYPFMDLNLSDYITNLPISLKNNDIGQGNKVIIREYLKDNLPQNYLEKIKGDLVFDSNLIYRNNDKQITKDIFQGLSQLVPNLNFEFFNKNIEKYFNSEYYSSRMYSLLILSRWVYHNSKIK